MKTRAFDYLMVIVMAAILLIFNEFELMKFSLIPMIIFYFAGKYSGGKSKEIASSEQREG